MKQVAIETLDAPEIQTWTPPDVRYSQPLPERIGGLDGVIVRAGFVGKGANKRIGFHFVRKTTNGYKKEKVEVTRENEADERPRGFFSSLSRLYAGRGQR